LSEPHESVNEDKSKRKINLSEIFNIKIHSKSVKSLEICNGFLISTANENSITVSDLNIISNRTSHILFESKVKFIKFSINNTYIHKDNNDNINKEELKNGILHEEHKDNNNDDKNNDNIIKDDKLIMKEDKLDRSSDIHLLTTNYLGIAVLENDKLSLINLKLLKSCLNKPIEVIHNYNTNLTNITALEVIFDRKILFIGNINIIKLNQYFLGNSNGIIHYYSFDISNSHKNIFKQKFEFVATNNIPVSLIDMLIFLFH